jgi:glycosyltransferase involved in cell wall biosynthesis
MSKSIDFSIIIPVWRGAIKYLPKLFNSIPEKDGIEIIVVDNSENPVRRDEILSDRDFVFLHSDHNRHAGGSRNDGIVAAKGKWLIFADADDFFSENAFDVFYKYIDTDAEIVYTCPQGVFEDTNEYSDRGEHYYDLVCNYIDGKVSEEDLRYGFGTPWAKMVSHALVDREQLRYDEIRASNDIYFSATTGYFARIIDADKSITYFVTVNRGSLTRRRDFESLNARLYGSAHRNLFFRQHGLKSRQTSVMAILYKARKLSFTQKLRLIKTLILFRQNPFIGWRNWSKSFPQAKEREIIEQKYIVR